MQSLHALSEAIDCEPAYVAVMREYDAASRYVTRFLEELSANPKKDTVYDDEALRAQLLGH